MSTKDKIVIITGAGSGIGAATAKLFGKQGARVVVSDLNLKNAQKIDFYRTEKTKQIV